MTTRANCQIERLEEAVSALQNQQNTMTTQLNEILAKLATIDTTSSSTTSPDRSSQSSLESKPHLKLDIPRYDGSDTMGWIFKITQFFEFHSTPVDDRVKIASFYLDGPALSWYQWMYNNRQFRTWLEFITALEQRFAPTMYDDPRGALFKLTQRGTVNAYLTEFEGLANRIVGLPSSFLLSCFISGLSSELRREVQAFQPLSLAQAAALARLQEKKFHDARRHNRTRPAFAATPLNSVAPSSSPPLLPAPPKTTFRRLTTTEMAACREQGLCYNCDDRYSPGYKCKSRCFLLIADDDDPETTPTDNPTELEPELDPIPEPETTPSPAQLSLHVRVTLLQKLYGFWAVLTDMTLSFLLMVVAPTVLSKKN